MYALLERAFANFHLLMLDELYIESQILENKKNLSDLLFFGFSRALLM